MPVFINLLIFFVELVQNQKVVFDLIFMARKHTRALILKENEIGALEFFFDYT